MSDLQGWTEENLDNAIAVIGMAGRFPGAENVDELWEVLRRGEETIEDLTDEDLLARGVPQSVLDEPHYVRRSASLSGIEDFDEEFFGFTPAAAAMLDPQHRLFLESCQHAFDDAGISTDSIRVPVGVFGSCPTSSYYQYNVLSHHDPRVVLGSGMEMELVQSALSTDSNFFATRASHTFDLRGPSVSVQTGCSSALVSLHLAIQSLLSGECEMALAGAYSIRVPHRVGYLAEPGAMVSPDGVCRPFDAAANGTIFGSGGGALLLRPLRAALEEGDHVRAVVRGSAINNDGALKMGFTAPSVDAQAEAVAEAIAVSGVDPNEIGYVEAHGTGTPIGDPIEMLALSRVFGEYPRKNPCAVGSIKGNIGHLDLAAGVAGIIKVIVAMEHRTLPATSHYRSPNPELHLNADLFEIVDRTRTWDQEGRPLLAGVSSLGVGGTNAHVVLQEPPAQTERTRSTGPYPLVLSARTPAAVRQAADALARHLESRPDLDLGDVAHTLDEHRTRYPHHLVTVVNDTHDAVDRLRATGGPLTRTGTGPGEEPHVAFLMPGQGSQYGRMTAGLHQRDPVFREALDGCLEHFGDLLGRDVAAALWEDGDTERTDIAQALLFSVETALAKLLRSRGVEPSMVAGHSIGEYAAAVVAGVMSHEDAVRIVAIRGELMRDAAPGAMLSVGLPEERVAQLVEGGPLEVATVNSVGTCVVAGPSERVAALAARLEEQGVDVRRLHTAHAFHTSAMDEATREFGRRISGITLHPPRLPITSNITGTWMSDEEATDPLRWARQIRSAVRFADNAAVLLERARGPLVECGPGRTLTGLLRGSPAWSKERHEIVQPVRHPSQEHADHERFLLALGQLRASGTPVKIPASGDSDRARRVPLPGYPFQRQRRWIDSLYARGHVHADVGGGATSTVPTDGGGPETGSTTERVLAEAWSELLGVEEIDPQANFFDLGGDSLVAVQVAGRVNRKGFDMSPKMLFDHPTIASLTAVLGAGTEQVTTVPAPADPAPTASTSTGHDVRPFDSPVTLTPAQRMIRAQAGARAPRALLELGPECDISRLERVLSDLAREHDALRLRVEESEDAWTGRIVAHDDPIALAWVPLEVFPAGDPDVTNPTPVEAAIHELAVGLTPERPWRTAILTLAGVPTHLAVAALPEVCDLVAMRHLQQEVLDHYSGSPRAVPSGGVSWAAWVEETFRSNNHRDLFAAVHRWEQHTAGCTRALGQELLRGQDTRATATEHVRIATVAPQEVTATPVEGADESLSLVLAHLAAVAAPEGSARLLVEVLGDGRPQEGAYRTVGEYTTPFPLVLDARNADPRTGPRRVASNLAEARTLAPLLGTARHVFEPTRRMLRDLPEGVVAVRDLGEQGLTGEGDVRPIGAEHHSAALSPPVSSTPVELRVYTLDGELHLDWWVDPGRVDPSRVRELAGETLQALERTVVAQPREAGPDEDRLRSRFPLAELSAEEAAVLFEQIPERTTT